MFPKLCMFMLFTVVVPDGLQAGPTTNTQLKGQTIDNIASERPSQIKCKEYSTLRFQDQEHKGKRCEIMQNATETGYPMLGEMPHMAMISSAYLPFRGGKMDRVCGGALISESYVLSSGTCGYIVQMLNQEGDVFIRLGEVRKNFLDETEIDGGTQVIKIAQTILHPKFNREEDSPYNIALFQLAIPAQINDFVRPTCLRINENLDDVPLVVTDWKRGENHSHFLRKSKSKAIPYEECKMKSSSEKRDTDTEMCVDRESDTGTPCGDDGANVLQTVSSEPYCSYHLVGFSGIVRCWTIKEPQKMMFNRLAQYVPWIESTVWT